MAADADARAAKVTVLPDAGAVARRGAELFAVAAQASVGQAGRFVVALSGGRTPAALYDVLASDTSLRSEIPWSRCFFFFGDERHVTPAHRDSNYRMAQQSLLSRVPIDPSQVFRIKGELESADRAALEYEEAIRGFFELLSGQLPRFDLVMLGLGSDGHVASLFPGTAALDERERLAVANRNDQLETDRITLTLPVLNAAARVMVLVQGSDKSQALAAVVHGEPGQRPLPAQLVQPTTGTMTWIVDQLAAALL